MAYSTGARLDELVRLNLLSIDRTQRSIRVMGNQGQSPVVGINVQGTASDGRKVFITGGAIIRYDPGCAQ
jgi:site-specific recombinase XerD